MAGTAVPRFPTKHEKFYTLNAEIEVRMPNEDQAVILPPAGRIFPSRLIEKQGALSLFHQGSFQRAESKVHIFAISQEPP